MAGVARRTGQTARTPDPLAGGILQTDAQPAADLRQRRFPAGRRRLCLRHGTVGRHRSDAPVPERTAEPDSFLHLYQLAPPLGRRDLPVRIRHTARLQRLCQLRRGETSGTQTHLFTQCHMAFGTAVPPDQRKLPGCRRQSDHRHHDLSDNADAELFPRRCQLQHGAPQAQRCPQLAVLDHQRHLAQKPREHLSLSGNLQSDGADTYHAIGFIYMYIWKIAEF